MSADVQRVASGRTVTAKDDYMTRLMGPLPFNAVLVMSGAVYGVLGLALPLLVGANTLLLVCCNVIGAALGLSVLLAWLFPLTQARRRIDLLERASGLRLLSAVEFEVLVGELLRREGWSVHETGRHGEPDGGVDLRIHCGDQARLVQCKRWDSRAVGVGEVRKLAGTLLREGLNGSDGVLVTSADFTAAADAEAKAIGLELVGRDDLIGRLEAAGALHLLAGARDLTHAVGCPNCGQPMGLDRSAYGWWIHCPDYGAGCTGKRDLGPDGRKALKALLTSA